MMDFCLKATRPFAILKVAGSIWHIVYLGDAVSGGLNHKTDNDARLSELGLPVLQSADAIAEAIGMKINTLRFITFNRRVSRVSNYVRFEIPKRSGGTRRISAPLPTLKYTQDWVLRNMLEKLPLNPAAQGFCRDRSIVSNAKPHVGADVVINIDLKDFFPTLTYKRVKGLFRSFGYSEAAATIFGLMCTEPDVDEVEMDGKTWGQSGNVLSSIWGYANFVAMVDPKKGVPLQMRVWKILEQQNWQKPTVVEERRPAKLPSVVPGTILADREAARKAEEAAAAESDGSAQRRAENGIEESAVWC